MGFDFRELRRLRQVELPEPLDVPNFLTPKPNDAYRAYALAVAPLLMRYRARVLWAGHHAASVLGEPRSPKLMIVRYPSHRSFIRMITTPYYLGANLFRVRGVAHFEASFTTPIAPGSIRLARRVAVVHLNTDDGDAETRDRPTLARIDAIVREAGGDLIYASVESSPMTFVTDPRPTDPNPLRYREMAWIAFRDADPVDALSADIVDAIGATCDDVAIQVYQRIPTRDLLLKGA